MSGHAEPRGPSAPTGWNEVEDAQRCAIRAAAARNVTNQQTADGGPLGLSDFLQWRGDVTGEPAC